MRMRRVTRLRTRLTIWYGVVLAAVLLVFVAVTSFVLYWQLWNQLDRHAVQDLETVEGLLSLTPEGMIHFDEGYHNHPESRLVQDRFLEVLRPDGAILFRNDRLGARTLGGALLDREGEGGYSNRSEHLSDGTRVLLVSRRHAITGRPTIIRLGYAVDSIWGEVTQWIAAGLLALPGVLILTGLAGYGLAGRALRPIEQMAGRADAITAERLSERLPVGDAGEELAHLAQVFNRLLARLEDSFRQLQRFTSDASHELRTPLAAIRSVGEVGLQRDESKEQYRDVIGSMLEEVNRLTGLVDSLLAISRADAGTVRLNRTTFSVGDVVREATSLMEVLVEEKGQQLIVCGDHVMPLSGDRVFLRQAIVNILHNAVKYSPAGGTIHVRIRTETGSDVFVEVTDSGPGVPPEHIPRLFDRFYRVEESRSRNGGGAGLGLSIAKWAVEAHGGRISLQSPPGQGATFQIQLPAA
jgi:heavy metal sensor kinase